MLQDLRYSFKQLLKNPGFTATAILSLALGIGATTAVFSVVWGVMMNPYPYYAADRMIHLVLKDPAGNEHWIGLSGPQLKALRQVSGVESVAAYDEWNLTTTDQDVPEDATGIYFTANAWSHFGVPALLGRGLILSDAPEGQDPQPVVVLGYQFWQRHYGGDRGVVGHTIQLVHKPYTIVGIAQPRFAWGDGDVYLPLKVTQDPTKQFAPSIRLKPGVSHATANAQLQALMEEFAKETPAHFPKKFHVAVKGLNDQFVERLGHTLFLLFGAVALLLIIGCANVSILLLARGTARQHELAVRAALGANRIRIVRQLLTESLTLSIVGAGLGVLLAYRIVAFIVAWLPEYSFPHEAAIRINLPVLIFSVALALLTGILFGLSPALQFSRPKLAEMMTQSNTRRMSGGVRGKRTHNTLVAGQIALTLVLLTIGIPVHDNTYMTWEKRSQYFDQLQQRMAAMPEVISAGISTNATPPSNGWNTRFEILGKPVPEQQDLRANLISPEYFSVLHIPLLQGKIWNHAENMRGIHVAVINQTLARQYWPNGDAIGHQIRLPEMKSDSPYALAVPGSDGWRQIIGIVADARDDGLRKPVKPAVYVPFTTVMQMWTQVLVRTRVPPLSILHAARAQVHAVDPDQQVIREVRNLDQWITTQPEWAQERMVATLFGAFSILALVLAAVGLYSVVSYTVAQRTNEFGIRMALGAKRKDVLRLVFRSTAANVGSGLVAGILLSVILDSVISKWAEGASRNPLIVVGVTLALIAASVAACLLPALRASAADPMTALRYE